jgi:regulator of sigma E protease
MDVLKYIGAVIAILFVIVVVHEMGHYLVAKWAGIQVDEFAVGFGPRLVSKRIGETIYAIRALPVGGFVRLAGMTGLEEPDPGPRAFWRATIPKRTLTLVAGGVFNLIFAGIIFTILAVPSQGSTIGSAGPSYAAGLRSGDRVLSVNGRSIDLSDPQSAARDLHAVTNSSDGKPLSVLYQSPDGTQHTIAVHPYLTLINEDSTVKLPTQIVVDTIDGQPAGTGDPARLFRSGSVVTVTGHALSDTTKRYTATVGDVTTGDGTLGAVQAAWRLGINDPGYNGNALPYALGRGFSEVPSGIAGTFTGLYQILTTPHSGGLSGNLQGPVGIIRDTGAAAQAGWIPYVTLMGFLSLNLGLFNLLPIPFLDGGRFVFVALEAIRRRRLDPRREAAFHLAGLMLILTLAVYVTLTGDIGGRTT